MAFIIKKENRLFSRKIKNRLPIAKDLPEKILEDESLKIEDLNMDTVFKFALAGYIWISELFYTTANLKKILLKIQNSSG